MHTSVGTVESLIKTIYKFTSVKSTPLSNFDKTIYGKQADTSEKCQVHVYKRNDQAEFSLFSLIPANNSINKNVYFITERTGATCHKIKGQGWKKIFSFFLNESKLTINQLYFYV